MKRLVTVSFLVLTATLFLTAAANAQIVFDNITINGRDGFHAEGLTDGDVYAVSATVNGTPLLVYELPDGPDVTEITVADGQLYLFIIPPPLGGTVELTATPVGGGTVLTGSQYYEPTGSITSTTTLLSTTPTSQVYGAVILTATVTPIPDGGTVTFKDGESTLGTGTLHSPGVWNIHADGLIVGVAHSITAVYSGNTNFATSTSDAISLTVTPANLTVIGITADSKIYDGETTATLHTAGASLQGDVSGDGLSADYAHATGTFSDKNIGGGKTVSIAVAISGNLSNYTYIPPTTTADISPKVLTVSGITANDKVYDGATLASLNTGSAALAGVVGTEVVTSNFASAIGNFDSKNVGDGKSVTVSGLSLAGTDAGNYLLTQPSVTGSITARPLTVAATGVNKVYDGTTNATVTLSDNRVAGDSFTDSYTSASFSDPNVGTGKTVTVSGISISGADAANYLANTTATTTADITAAPTNTGSVVGAGLITSPAGAYPSKPTYTGKGYFGFAAGFVKNNPLPIGVTTFALKSSGLFSSTAFSFLSLKYESLVLTGAEVTLKGEGKVNGSGKYGFLLSAIDGHASHSADKLRMKIWDKNHSNAVFYDSQMGAADDADPTATVTGGVITISKTGGSSTAMDMNVQQLMEDATAAEIPTEYALRQNYPNPFNPSTTIRFDLPEAAKVRLVVYDMLGREVAVLADGERPAGQHSLRFDAGKLSSGLYIYRLQTGNYTQTKKMMLMK